MVPMRTLPRGERRSEGGVPMPQHGGEPGDKTTQQHNIRHMALSDQNNHRRHPLGKAYSRLLIPYSRL